MSDAPAWIDDVSAWLVSYAEARYGLCRMLLWFADSSASVVMPAREYHRAERSLDEQLTLPALWRRGLLPDERPAGDAVAPLLRDPVLLERGRNLIERYEAEHGAFTADELAEVDAQWPDD